jgi:hypothetical protein
MTKRTKGQTTICKTLHIKIIYTFKLINRIQKQVVKLILIVSLLFSGVQGLISIERYIENYQKRAQSHSPAQRLRGMEDSCYIFFNLFVS